MKFELSPAALTSPGRAISERARWENALTKIVDTHFSAFLNDITEQILEAGEVNPVMIDTLFNETVHDILAEVEVPEDTLTVVETALRDDPLPSEVYDTASYILSETQALGLSPDEVSQLLRAGLDYDAPSITSDTSLQASAMPRIIGQALARSVGRGKRWRNRSRETSRTAATTALNETQSRVIQRSDFTHKQWITRRDDHVRPTHSAADGQTVPKASLFQVGSAQLLYPGQGSYPPEEVINCRCVTIATNADGSTR